MSDDPELDDVPPIDNSRPDIERVCKHLQRRMVENGFPRPAITCRPVEVDSETIRVHGAAEMTDEDRGHFAEIVRAAKRRMEDECQKPHLSGHEAAVIRRALEALPKTCKYHGDKLERHGSAWMNGACCDTGKPSLLRRKAEAALARTVGPYTEQETTNG